ncbi:MAG TPA: 30S ribosomal protein S10 [candidate division Zixibacteria bacterium]|nr:30S ribosomal protein S10 [candidate division Zixibacteria bacterium]
MAQRMRIRLRSYDHVILDRAAKEIVEMAKKTGAIVAGPVPLPTKRRVYTVLRSTFIDKKSREQFEVRIHKRLIDIYGADDKTMDEMTHIELPAGVDIEILLG